MAAVADHISQVINSSSHNQRKALIEALVAQVKITGPGRIVPSSASCSQRPTPQRKRRAPWLARQPRATRQSQGFMQ